MDYLKKYWVQCCLIGIIAISFFLMIFSASKDSLIIDEKVHIPAGYLHVWRGDYTFNTEHPPMLNDLAGLFAKIAKPNVPEIPANFTGGDQWEYGDLFFYKSGNDVDKVLFWARFPFIFLTLGLIYLVFLWARALFGDKAGLFAAALTAFSPNILAHGRLATTDIGVAFFFLLTGWVLRKYFLKPSWVNAAFLGFSLGMVLLSKFSSLSILPVIFLGLVLLWFFKKPNFFIALGQFLLILTIPLILIWGVYAFSMRSYLAHLPPVYEMSKTLDYKTLSKTSSKWLIVPFDKFTQGLEIISDHNIGGHWAYLNGKVDYGGWWYYFPYVVLYKLTLVELVLLISAIVSVIARRPKADAAISDRLLLPRQARGRNDNYLGGFDEFLIIFPPLLFLAIAMLGRINIGLRHILPILPFFYIFISGLMIIKNFYLKTAILLLVISQIAIGILAFPNYIAYFNQIAGGAKGGIKHLADSNLDWNQNMKRFGEYAYKNNITKVYELCWDGYSFSYYGVESEIIPNSPINGVVVLCAEQMLITPEGFDISWVTKEPPDDIVGNAMYVWRFDEKDVK